MTIAREDIFGPVMCILKFRDLDEVVARANATTYGLAAGVVTSDSSKVFGLVNTLKAGTVFVNCYNANDVVTPFGGYRNSGVGRELGEAGLKNYLETKTVIISQSNIQ